MRKTSRGLLAGLIAATLGTFGAGCSANVAVRPQTPVVARIDAQPGTATPSATPGASAS
jgi:hypothetical protein